MTDLLSRLPPPIANQLRAEDASARRGATIGGAIVATIGLGIAIALYSYAARHGRAFSPRTEEWIPMLVGLAICALGVRWFLSRNKPDPRIATLANSNVVWLYNLEKSSSSSGYTSYICLGTDTGELIKLEVACTRSPYEQEQAKVRQKADLQFKEILPHYPKAAIGFTPENQAAFNKYQGAGTGQS